MLIGLHGKARVGKDTVYEMLAEDFEYSPFSTVRRDAFADRLKIAAARSLGYHGDDKDGIAMMNLLKLEGSEITVFIPTTTDGTGGIGKAFTGREYLQWFGTEGHRDVFEPDFWVNAVLPHNWVDDPEEVLVITDVRFPNEAERIRDLGGDVWLIERPEVEGDDSHASEQVLPFDLLDYTIVNDSTLEELRAQVHIGLWASMSQVIPQQVIQEAEDQ